MNAVKGPAEFGVEAGLGEHADGAAEAGDDGVLVLVNLKREHAEAESGDDGESEEEAEGGHRAGADN